MPCAVLIGGEAVAVAEVVGRLSGASVGGRLAISECAIEGFRVVLGFIIKIGVQVDCSTRLRALGGCGGEC